MDDAARLRWELQHFVRGFGLLAGDRTPCGQPLPPSHAHALLLLLQAAEPPTQADLGAELGIDKSNVARLCARLEASGHLAQRPCSRDGRARRLALTEKGLRLAAAVEEASRARFEALLGAVPAADRAAVIQSLHLLNRALGALQAPAAPPQEKR